MIRSSTGREIVILAIERVKSVPRSDGSQVVAFLDIAIPDMEMIGCILMRKSDGSLRFNPPSLSSKKIGRHAISITNTDLYDQLLDVSARAWRGLNADEETREELGRQ